MPSPSESASETHPETGTGIRPLEQRLEEEAVAEEEVEVVVVAAAAAAAEA